MVPGLKIKADDANHSRTTSMRRGFWNFRMRDSHAYCLLEMNEQSLYAWEWAACVSGHTRRRAGLMFVRVVWGVRPHRHRRSSSLNQRDFKSRLSRNVAGA